MLSFAIYCASHLVVLWRECEYCNKVLMIFDWWKVVLPYWSTFSVVLIIANFKSWKCWCVWLGGYSVLIKELIFLYVSSLQRVKASIFRATFLSVSGLIFIFHFKMYLRERCKSLVDFTCNVGMYTCVLIPIVMKLMRIFHFNRAAASVLLPQ